MLMIINSLQLGRGRISPSRVWTLLSMRRLAACAGGPLGHQPIMGMAATRGEWDDVRQRWYLHVVGVTDDSVNQVLSDKALPRGILGSHHKELGDAVKPGEVQQRRDDR